jgi:hypothetical protein
MTDKINDGGSAFPTTGEGYGYSRYSHNGMTLRDWFAGQALAGILANPETAWTTTPAVTAYNYANAMLAERDRRK